jgi:hypothetical protein
MQFPPADGENLAGQQRSFPRDFDGARTIALVAFDFKHRAALDTWFPFISRLASGGTTRGLLFPVLSESMRGMKAMITMAMRKETDSPEAREATVPLFVDLDAFCASLGIADYSDIHTFLVEVGGTISEHRVGPYDESAGSAIEARAAAPIS